MSATEESRTSLKAELKADPILVEIVAGTLAAVELEVESAIGRTSRSPMIRDAHDFRAGIHDLKLLQGAALVGVPSTDRAFAAAGHRWSPFRSYAGMHLWRIALQERARLAAARTTTSTRKRTS